MRFLPGLICLLPLLSPLAHAELIDDGKAWLDIVIDRIKYNPVYEMDSQHDFVERVLKIYIPMLEKFEDTMTKKLDE